MNIRRKLIFQITPIFLLLIITLSSAYYLQSSKQHETSIQQLQLEAIEAQALSLNTFIENQPLIVDHLTYNPIILDLLRDPNNPVKVESANQLLDDYAKRSPIDLEGLFIHYFASDEHLVMIANINRDLMGLEEKVDSTFERMRETKEYQISDVFISPSTGKPIILFIYPLIDPIDGEVKAAIGTPLFAKDFANYAKDMKLVNLESSYAYLVDNNGNVLYHPDETKIGKPVETPEINEIVNKINNKEEVSSGVITYKFDNEHIISAYSVIPKTNWLMVTRADVAEVNQPLKKILFSIIGMALVGIIASIIYIILIARRISKPIIEITELVDETANFNLLQNSKYDHLLKLNDEIGIMAHSVYKTRQKLRDIVTGIKSTTNATLSNSEKLSDSLQTSEVTIMDVSLATNEMASNSGTLAETSQLGQNKLNDLSVEIENAMRASETAKGHITVTQQASSNGRVSIHELQQSIEKSQKVTHLVGEKMVELDAKSEIIESIIDTITNITSQINLLSLNASIESARAGEAGKGFAVVANEIKNLAHQTESSAKEIEQVIQDFKQIIVYSKDEMLKAKETLTATEQKSQETTYAFDAINLAVTDIITQVNNLIANTVTINSNKMAVSKAIESVTVVATENAATTEEISASIEEQTKMIQSMSQFSKNLQSIVESLNKLVDEFIL